MLSYPIDGGSIVNIVLLDFEYDTWEHDKWVLPADPEVVRSMFSTWGAKAQGLVDVS